MPKPNEIKGMKDYVKNIDGFEERVNFSLSIKENERYNKIKEGKQKMNWHKTTGKTIQKSFEDFHKNNPIVYEYFKEFAFQAIKKGKNKISFKMIMNVIRWDIFINTEEDDSIPKMLRFKLSDAYHSRYARLFVSEFPQYKELVVLRALRTE